MKELAKEIIDSSIAREEKLVSVFINNEELELTGTWKWDLQSDHVFCSDVMFLLSSDMQGSRGLIHPDDQDMVAQRLRVSVGGSEIPFLQFRIITSFGKIETLVGKRIVRHKASFLGEILKP